jgi:hypothetical protein
LNALVEEWATHPVPGSKPTNTLTLLAVTKAPSLEAPDILNFTRTPFEPVAFVRLMITFEADAESTMQPPPVAQAVVTCRFP